MTDKTDIAIEVLNISKAFKLPHERHNSFKSAIIHFAAKKSGYERQKVLNNINFQIKKGEFFGIVGRNGSGKSTLLKLLAGIYSPDKGHITLNGTLTPFIELGVGFNMELTGRENIFLNGALLGFDHKDMEAMYDDIVEFAELEKFMDQKLKNYSSGMQVRLAFSIAVRAKTDILLLDEVLAVGDADFQRKCLLYFAELKKNKQTVVFVSHDMESVKEYCDRAVLIEKGRVKMIGDPRDIVPEYMSGFVESEDTARDDLPFGIAKAVKIEDSILKITKVWLEDENARQLKVIDKKTPYFFVKFNITATKDVADIIPGVIVSNPLGEFVTASNFKWADFTGSSAVAGGRSYQVTFKMSNIFEQGHYKISVNVVSKDFDAFYAWKNEVCSLYVNKAHQTGGMVNPSYEVEMSQL